VNEERQLDPTPLRIARARRDGNFPRSSELVAACAFGMAAIVACGLVTPIGTFAADAVRMAARGVIAYRDLGAMLSLAAAPALGGALAAIFGGIAQARGVRFTSVAWRLERLDPIEGARRMLSRETAAHMLRATTAFALAVAAIAPSVAAAISGAATASGIGGVASVTWPTIERTLFVACAVGLLFAFAEYALLRSAWLRKLRMSVDELKREIKEQEGDPHVRGRRRGLRREILRGSLQSVRKAAFVVVNPTHVAIALAYDPPATPVPRVLVRAAEAAAQRVREMATRLRIPVVENAWLARALFRDAVTGLPIPVEHYVAVAEVVVALSRSGALESSAS
jgi:flagellar biosynthesis protein FlhB